MSIITLIMSLIIFGIGVNFLYQAFKIKRESIKNLNNPDFIDIEGEISDYADNNHYIPILKYYVDGKEYYCNAPLRTNYNKNVGDKISFKYHINDPTIVEFSNEKSYLFGVFWGLFAIAVSIPFLMIYLLSTRY